LPGRPGDAEFTAAYDALLQGVSIGEDKRARIIFAPTTLGGVIEQYLSSSAFKSKAPVTRRIYRRILDRLSNVAGRGLIVDLREKHVRKIRQHFRSSSVADEAVMLLGMLWVFAKEDMGMHQLGANPATDIRRLHRRARVYEPWPIELIDQLAVQGSATARLALSLLLYTGQRVGDVAAMKWSQYDSAGISVRQEKTNAPLWIPTHTALKAALDSASQHSEFILGAHYTAGSLSRVIKRELRKLGAARYTAHGLRKNAAIVLAEAGCTPHEIAAITGHDPCEWCSTTPLAPNKRS
jgi:integrase